MPVLDSVNHLKHRPRPDAPLEKAVKVYEKDKLLLAAEEILGIIADNNLVLCTGHLSPHESLLLIEDAKRLGVKKIVVTHPFHAEISASLEQQEEMAKKGAYIEHCFSTYTPYYRILSGYQLDFSQYVASIKKVGAEHCIISSDLGQEANPPPVEGLRSFIFSLLMSGVTPKEIEYMVKINPAHLLGIKT